MRVNENLYNFSYAHELVYQLKVRDAMTPDPVSITPKNTLREARIILRNKKISGLPVLEGTRLVGIISVEDIIRALDDNEIDALVEKRMTRDVKTMDPQTTLIKAIQMFQDYPLGRFPVIDRKGNLVGIMTPSDVTRRLLFELNKVVDEAFNKEASLLSQNYPITIEEGKTLLKSKVQAGDFNQAGILSQKLKKKLHEMGIKPEIIRRIAIAAYEAETNIIIHSTGGSINAWIERGNLILEAIDSGPGIKDVTQAMQPGFSTANDRVRALGFGAGMGLPNIQRCADQFDIKSESGQGTELKIEIQLKLAEPTLSDTIKS